jgi:hypothetical protein
MLEKEKYQYFVLCPNERPDDFRLVAVFLWGDDQDVDSDGDSYNPASREWTELFLHTREYHTEQVSITPCQTEPLIVSIRSLQKYIAARTAFLLAKYTNGKVSNEESGPYQDADTIIPDMGKEFDLEEAWTRFWEHRFIRSTLENPYPE